MDANDQQCGVNYDTCRALLPIAVVDVGAAAGSAELAHQQVLIETTARLVQILEVLRVE